ncbi:MAG: hypothetical protein ACOYK8_03385 [Alphaproteobacteria bacterium]
MQKINKVVRISLAGGIVGLLATNPRRALDNTIDKQNQDGWNCHQILPHSERNLLVILLQVGVLLCTFGLYTWGAGYIILFEKDTASIPRN